MFLCFAAVSIRNEETRTAINENLVQPFLNFKSNHEVTHVSHIVVIYDGCTKKCKQTQHKSRQSW